MSRARSLLRPEEEVVFHNNPGPDWRGEHPESVPASRVARLARQERLLSRRYGEPVSCAAVGGPEARNGGWIK
jgi:hypothetical protein